MTIRLTETIRAKGAVFLPAESGEHDKKKTGGPNCTLQ
jgi:hypothetical protein